MEEKRVKGRMYIVIETGERLNVLMEVNQSLEELVSKPEKYYVNCSVIKSQ
ncbi:autonomous glycyl radical cofactor GrcA [Pullulanibacillus pueri]|uniref:Uncharacterized protein n=1 Tax=Pullulanibacillus pueri TaxID=1437324 RepID=A0A8J3EL19_9BACL|nr:hypothetical protein [Pullulanibacillus pueri]MBM7681153.1 autonomous glycyl radical cofactor GrcA [Pullulanibacillus pueri]GGH77253.1 hypothetical protein GCM10007096_08880 [Pullulanibacillus pueri]